MEWLKKHVDTVVVVGTVVAAAMWMQASIHRLEIKFEKEIAIIKTVLIMKNIMPTELAKDHSTAPKAKTPSDSQ